MNFQTPPSTIPLYKAGCIQKSPLHSANNSHSCDIGTHNPMADQNRLTNSQWFRRLLGSFGGLLKAFFTNLQLFISCIFQVGELSAGIFPHVAFAFNIGAIIGLLQVKYQGKDKSPFESHPRTILVATTSLLIYCLAYGIEQKFFSDRRYRIPTFASNTIRCCMLLAGSLALAATASFLFPDSVRPILFVFYFTASAGELLLYWLCERYTREDRGTHGLPV